MQFLSGTPNGLGATYDSAYMREQLRLQTVARLDQEAVLEANRRRYEYAQQLAYRRKKNTLLLVAGVGALGVIAYLVSQR